MRFHMNENVKIEKILKLIFGEIYFNQLKKFFQQFYFIDYLDFVIFTTRRCHVLFCIFNKYFKVLPINNKVKFISDKAIHFYGDELKGSSCAIVDDILIHGRALKSVYNRVKSKSPSNIETYVYMQSESSLYTANRVTKNQVTKNEWKAFSNKIVSAILLTTFPYTSYVCSWSECITIDKFYSLFKILKKKLPQYKNLDVSINKVDNKTEINNLLSTNLIGFIFDVSDFSERYGLDFSCIRLYYNKYLEKCVIIPYCITHPLSTVEIDKIIEHYFEENSTILVSNQYEPKYRAITTLYSYALMEYLENEIVADMSGFTNNFLDIEMSYYSSFFDELSYSLQKHKLICLSHFSDYLSFNDQKCIAHKSNSNEQLNEDVYQSVLKRMVSSESDNCGTFFDTSNSVNDVAMILFDYLTKVNIEEATLFNKINEPEKQAGLSLSSLSILIRRYQLTNLDFYSEIIASADSGFLSIFADHYFYDRNSNKQFYSNFLITGEQVCRLFQNKYVVFVTDLYKSYSSFKHKYNINMNFKTILSKLKTSKLLDSRFDIIDNINKAYVFVFSSSNKKSIIDNSFENLNDALLEELFEEGIKIIIESV